MAEPEIAAEPGDEGDSRGFEQRRFFRGSVAPGPEDVPATEVQAEPEVEPEPEPEPEPATDPAFDYIAPYRRDEYVSEPADGGFEDEPVTRPRRNPLKLWTWAATIFALLAAGTIVAITTFGLPNWVPASASPTFARANPALRLDFPPERQERRQLPNGTEYFGVNGTITNVGEISERVPPILIVLRDEAEEVVFSWEIVPPQSSLAPGESVSVTEAVTDVPATARFADIGWKPS